MDPKNEPPPATEAENALAGQSLLGFVDVPWMSLGAALKHAVDGDKQSLRVTINKPLTISPDAAACAAEAFARTWLAKHDSGEVGSMNVEQIAALRLFAQDLFTIRHLVTTHTIPPSPALAPLLKLLFSALYMLPQQGETVFRALPQTEESARFRH